MKKTLTGMIPRSMATSHIAVDSVHALLAPTSIMTIITTTMTTTTGLGAIGA